MGFLVAGAAMSAPDVAKHVTGWSTATIYPWWGALYAGIGAVASIMSILLSDHVRARIVPTAVGIMAAQVAGLGFVAVKHWQPSFGMGGGYAGRPDELVQLAWAVGVAGTITAVTSVLQIGRAHV